jgi:hypothetical protein
VVRGKGGKEGAHVKLLAANCLADAMLRFINSFYRHHGIITTNDNLQRRCTKLLASPESRADVLD